MNLNSPSFPPSYPSEFGGYFVAMATLTGSIAVHVTTVEDLVKDNCRSFEYRENLTERMLPDEKVHPYLILGIFKDKSDAVACVERVTAWREGS